MIRFTLPKRYWLFDIYNMLNIQDIKRRNQYYMEFLPNFELTNNHNRLRKLRGIRFHAYKNYGLLRKNKINTHNEEFQTFLFGDKIKSH